jgi:hypothetical protein
MADTGWKSPGTVVSDNSVGTVGWSNPSNAKASDNNYAEDWGDGADSPSQYLVKIVKSDGSIGSTNKVTSGYIPSSDTYVSYGGSSDLWSETWSVSDINDADFGVAISYKCQLYDGPEYTYYLKATNFNFSIPSGSTINGIEVRVEHKQLYNLVEVDHIQIKVYYTEDSGTIANAGVSSSTTSSPSPSILGKASTSQNSDAVLLSSPSVSTAIGINISVNSDEISLTSLSPSLSAGVNLGVSVQESVLSSTAVLTSGKAITSPSTNEVLFTSLSPSLIAGIGVDVDSSEISLISLSPSLNISVNMSADEVSLTSLGIDSFSVSKDLTAIAFSIVNPAVDVDWDYLFINKPKNITNWSSKSKNSTTWIKRPKVLTNWEEI